MDEFDRMITQRATRRLIIMGITPIVAALISFCFNPLYVLSIIAIGSALGGISQPRTMKAKLDEHYPSGAGLFCIIASIVGLLIAALRILIGLAGCAMMAAS